MDFALTEEQQLIVTTTREFVRRELVPHEREVEESGRLREELRRELKARAIAAGLYGCARTSRRGRSPRACTPPTCPPRSVARDSMR